MKQINELRNRKFCGSKIVLSKNAKDFDSWKMKYLNQYSLLKGEIKLEPDELEKYEKYWQY